MEGEGPGQAGQTGTWKCEAASEEEGWSQLLFSRDKLKAGDTAAGRAGKNRRQDSGSEHAESLLTGPWGRQGGRRLAAGSRDPGLEPP